MKSQSQILILKWEIQLNRLKRIDWILFRDTPAKRFSLFLLGLTGGITEAVTSPHLWTLVYPASGLGAALPSALTIKDVCTYCFSSLFWFSRVQIPIQFPHFSYQHTLPNAINFSLWWCFTKYNVLIFALCLILSWTVELVFCSWKVVRSWAGYITGLGLGFPRL